MIVSDICALDKKRSKVFIDGEFAFVLYNGELRDFDIKVGNELSHPVFIINNENFQFVHNNPPVKILMDYSS